MPKTYSDDKYIYSVDMMFTYLYLNKMKSEKYPINKLLDNLSHPGWGDPITNVSYSPYNVLENPIKYKEDYDRIQNADLSYPIIINDTGNIIDGVHRLTKAVLSNKKYINCYIFNKKLMKKFIIAKANKWDYVDKLKVYQFMVLYIERFGLKKNNKIPN